MKKILLVALAALPAFYSNAQNTFPNFGYVGIGTTNPNRHIDIRDQSTDAMFIRMRNANSATGGALFGLNSNNHFLIRLRENKSFRLFTNNVERMRMTKNGFLGLGTSSPQATLDVVGGFRLDNGTQQVGYFLTTDANGNATWAALPNNNIWSLNGTSAYYTAGGVGIGTNAPLAALHVNSPSDEAIVIGDGAMPSAALPNSIIFTRATSGNLDHQIRWLDGNGSPVGAITTNTVIQQTPLLVLGSNSGDIAFLTDNFNNNGEKMRLTQPGNLGIGTTTPSARLHVAGSMRLENGTQAAGRVLTSDANGNASWANLPNTNIWSQNGSNVYYNGGFVGIGTAQPGSSTPNALLEVMGRTVINGTTPQDTRLTFSNAGIGATQMYWDETADLFNMQASRIGGAGLNFIVRDLNNAYHDVMTMATNTNIGINTQSPTAKLHLVGDLRIEDGTQGDGYVLTSDANGNASWQNPSNNLMGTQGNPYTELYVNDFIKIGTNSLYLASANAGVDNNIYTDNGDLTIQGNEGQGTIYNTIINPTSGKVAVGITGTQAKMQVHPHNLEQVESVLRVTYNGTLPAFGTPSINESIFEVQDIQPLFPKKALVVTRQARTGFAVDNPLQRIHANGNLLLDGSQGSLMLGGTSSGVNGEYVMTYVDSYEGAKILKPGGSSTGLVQNVMTFSKDGTVGAGTEAHAGVQMLVKTQNPTRVGVCVDMENAANYGYGVKVRADNDILKAIAVNQIGNGLDVFRVMGNGHVYATEVHVREFQDFPDYVFEEDYELRSIEELETFIKENKHLPNVPTAKTVAENGMELGELNRVLVEKVEELSLYIIELNKEIEALKAANQSQND